MDNKPRNSQLFYYVSVIIVLITCCVLLMNRLNISHETPQYLDIHHSSSSQIGFRVQDTKTTLEKENGENFVTKSKTSKIDEAWFIRMSGTIRRMLLGSSPPRCIAKCGRCSPCMPGRVKIQPGTPVLTEYPYYPEAWKCKCGNKYYNP